MNKDWLDIAVLEDYLDGKLDAKTMNRVEREALEDPFVSEALEGLSRAPRRSLDAMSLLQKQLHERVADQKGQKKRTVITWQRLSIAATAAVMFISVSVVFWMREDNRRKELAALPKKVEVNLAPRVEKDTISTAIAAADRTAVVINEVIEASKKESYASLKKKVKPEADQITSQDVQQSIVADHAEKKENVMARSVAVLPKAKSVFQGKAVDAIDGKPLPGADTSILSEVVVGGFGNAKKVGDVSTALAGKVAGVNTNKDSEIRIRGNSSISDVFTPVGGWDQFRDYLKKKNRFRNEAKTGKSVVLSFNLDKAGKPENIKVLMGIAEQYDQEAIRLLSKGPKWNHPKNEVKQLFVNIEF